MWKPFPPARKSDIPDRASSRIPSHTIYPFPPRRKKPRRPDTEPVLRNRLPELFEYRCLNSSNRTKCRWFDIISPSTGWSKWFQPIRIHRKMRWRKLSVLPELFEYRCLNSSNRTKCRWFIKSYKKKSLKYTSFQPIRIHRKMRWRKLSVEYRI